MDENVRMVIKEKISLKTNCKSLEEGTKNELQEN